MGGHASSLVDAAHGTDWLHGQGDFGSTTVSPTACSIPFPSHHGRCAAAHLGHWPPTSAASSSFTDVSPSEARKLIQEANAEDRALWEQVKSHRAALPAKRAALEDALNQRSKDMHPLCRDYMMRRSELAGIGAFECAAAQGRLNASEVGYDSGPNGCLDEPSFAQIKGTPATLPQARCTRSSHQLLCSERLRELLDGAPGPAPSTDTAEHHQDTLKSMDAEVREWCHPAYALPAKELSPELARGALPAAGSNEDEIDEGQNLDDSSHIE